MNDASYSGPRRSREVLKAIRATNTADHFQQSALNRLLRMAGAIAGSDYSTGLGGGNGAATQQTARGGWGPLQRLPVLT